MKKNYHLFAATALCVPARAFSDLNFDATTVAPDAGIGDPLPTGWYNMAMDESEMKPTNDGTGAYLKVRFTVLDGQYQGRKVWEQLNLRNNNAQTVEIAQKQLSAICHAVGVLKPAKSEELHNLPLKIRVGQKKAEGGYDAGNRIMAYKNINEQVDVAGGDAGAAAFGAGAAPAQPWTQGAAAAVAGAPPVDSAPPAQPWAPPVAAEAAPVVPTAPAAPEVPAAPAAVHDPLAAAVADGWIKHPSAAGYHYKGQEVKTDGDVAALYPAPAAAPVAPGAPPAPPAAPAAGDAQAAPPPWAKPAA